MSADVKGAIADACRRSPARSAIRHVRHLGTIGGSVANNDPAADYPAAVLALAGTVSTNKRQIAADQYFTGLYTTALEEGEIVTKIAFKVPAQSGYAKFRNPASHYPMAGVFVAKHKDGSVRVAVTGRRQRRRLPLERRPKARLAGNFSADALKGLSGRQVRHDGRHPRLGRVPRQPRRGHGPPRASRISAS